MADLDLLSEMRNNRDNLFIKKFRNIWADNGDAVSWHYTGTGSTHTEYSRDHIVSLEMEKGDFWATSSININPSLGSIIKTSGISIK